MSTPEAPQVSAAGAALAMAVVLIVGYVVATRAAGRVDAPTAAPCVCSCSFAAPPPVVVAPGAPQ